jgi:hypothetical protein
VGAAVRLARRGVHDLLQSLGTGRLHLHDPLGSRLFGAPGTTTSPNVSVRINDLSAYLDIATGGTIGAAEAYMAGKWTVSDLPGVVRLLTINRDVMNRLESGMARVGGVALKLAHFTTGTPAPAAGATSTPTTTATAVPDVPRPTMMYCPRSSCDPMRRRRHRCTS